MNEGAKGLRSVVAYAWTGETNVLQAPWWSCMRWIFGVWTTARPEA